MVYIPALKKNVLPIILKPKHDELFTSWFCRMSVEYGLKPHTFLQNYLEDKAPPLRRDLDLFENNHLMNFIINHTSFPKNKVRRLFLNELNMFAFKDFKEKKSYISNVLPLGVSNRKIGINTGIQYCPSCLKHQLYYKIKWRLVTSIICLRCYVQLKDQCPHCKSPINFIKIYTSNNTSTVENLHLNQCFKCKQNISADDDLIKATSSEITYQKLINGSIKNGFNSFSNYSFYYIEALLHFSLLLGSSRQKNNFRNYILDIYKLEIEPNKTHIHYWSVEYRRKILPVVNLFLQSNPTYEELKFYQITKSYIDPENRLPFWIYQKFNL